MKNYDNMVEPCLLDEPDEKHIIDTLPPPELHILMKIITALALLLRQFYEWDISQFTDMIFDRCDK